MIVLDPKLTLRTCTGLLDIQYEVQHSLRFDFRMFYLSFVKGKTALHWSCNNGYLDAVKLLLGCGAFPNHMEHTEER